MDHKILNILIADDDSGDIKQFKRVLQETGLSHVCTAVTSIEEALVISSQRAFDCIFVDYQLPGGMTGLDGIASLHRQCSEVPVIMLTGSGDEMVAIEAMKRGAFDYLVKENLTSELLKKSIDSVIDKALLEKQKKEKTSKIEYIADHDYLTDIPNRRLFHRNFSKALMRAERDKKMYAVMLLDLDRFKNINDALGHHVGDKLLKLVTDRFRSVLRVEDVLARLGGDEFGVLIRKLNDSKQVGLIANNLIRVLEKSFSIGHEKMNTTTSIGIAIYPTDGTTVSDLLRNADKAMYVAKHKGGNHFEFYAPEFNAPEFNAQMTQRLHIEAALRDAINNREFYLCYQPIYHLADNTLFGVEALLRWRHAEFEKIPIADVISVAEESGLIVSICDWVLNEALHQYAAWKVKYDVMFKLSINFSVKSMLSLDWYTKVKKLAETYQVDPHVLIFELTETDIMKDMTGMQKILSNLTAMGAQVFVDNFGTGFSSINIIRNLPAAGFKIDKSCMQQIEHSKGDKNFVNSLFVLAENMGLTVVAKGIEIETQFDFLKSYPKEKLQGYYLSKPLLPNEVERLLRAD